MRQLSSIKYLLIDWLAAAALAVLLFVTFVICFAFGMWAVSLSSDYLFPSASSDFIGTKLVIAIGLGSVTFAGTLSPSFRNTNEQRV